MNPVNPMKHNKSLPSARQIRRTCSRELYRARKKMGGYITLDLIKQADELYYKKVLMNLPYIAEHGSNRKVLADWFDENVCGEVAALWNVEPNVLGKAFRESFGG
ncbi:MULTISPECIES: dehydrogenase [unclassified Paenibacillus]|uniref:dehydrogenase n=1 Tax=unclassified Paenibacillus TaxID=185978 RepID=UPI001AE7DB12|nr:MULTISPECIES: dehydrogenase [unclassified Paenibacillus]MBP1157145.1 toxin CptA [Paenibacillus sp. PvP091]MBP1172116.1 toxin CptA [Paenibacillus sp. PvR098]MBP2438497.1 toxin CptA [Paenibacillus sp. PvP052]